MNVYAYLGSFALAMIVSGSGLHVGFGIMLMIFATGLYLKD